MHKFIRHCPGPIVSQDGTGDMFCPKATIERVEELEAENEHLKKDNRRMLILIAAMEKLLDVELTELI